MIDTRPIESETLFMPERSRPERLIALLAFVVSVVYLWPFRNVTELFQDEGIVLQGAQRILEGEVLYRDFFSFYTPGSFYWQALLFKLFGSSYLVARTLLPLYGGMFSLLTYLLARRVCGRWSALFGAYLFLVIGLPYRFLHLHNWDSMVLAYLALYSAVRFVEAPNHRWALATGTLVSLTALFEHSKGTGLLVGLALGFAILARWGRDNALLTRARLAALAGGLVWPFVPVVIYFAAQQALSQMLADWVWPLFHYSESNRLPYGWINLSARGWEALYGSGSWGRRLLSILFTSPCFIWPVIPFLAAAFLAFHALRLRRGTQSSAGSSYFVIVSAGCVGLALSAVMTQRADVQHLLFAGAPFSIVLAWVLGYRGMASELLLRARPLIASFLLVFFTAFGLVFWGVGPLKAKHTLVTRRGTVMTARPDEVIPYLIRHVAPGEKIFVYPQQPIYYFLTAARNPTPYDFLQLGMHSDEEFQQTLAALAADRTRLVIWDPAFNTDTILQGWPSTRLETLEKDPIKDFLLAHYRPCMALRSVDFRYVVMVREDLACAE